MQTQALPTDALPREDTSFVGRQKDLLALQKLLKEHTPLITILGPGGMGKTRLAVQACTTFSFPKKALFCDLSHARSADELYAALAKTLDTKIPPGASEDDQLNHLGETLRRVGSTILILDNLEQIAEPGSAALQEWLRQSPNTQFLVTSRENLHIPAASILSLSSLSSQSPESEAVQLFLDRAHTPALLQSPTALSQIQQIAQMLDGIPLAIELAAARTRILSPAQILARLGERFSLLRTRQKGKDPRQATLWNALDWSWQLLDPEEQEALAECTVFQGSFSLEAAEKVLSSQYEAMDLLEALVDRSLLRTWHSQAPLQEIRFGFYESIRAFAQSKLEVDQENKVRERHTLWFLQSGEERLRDLHGPEGQIHRAWLSEEQSNLTAALQKTLSEPERKEARERAVRLLLVLHPILSARGPFGSHPDLLDAVIGLPGECSQNLNAQIHEARGNLHRTRGRIEEALHELKRALQLAEQDQTRASIVANLGIALHEHGELSRARDHHEEALALFANLKDGRGEARALGSLAILHHEQGRLKEAERCYTRALSILQTEGDLRSESIFHTNLGDLYKEQNLLTLAHQCYTRALEGVRTLGEKRVEAVILGNMGGLLQEEGELEEAEKMRAAAIALSEEVGDRRISGIFTGYQGTLHHLQKKHGKAVLVYRRAVDLLEQSGDRRFEGIFLGYLCAAEASLGRLPQAEDAYQRAHERLSSLGDELLLEALNLHHTHLLLAQAREKNASVEELQTLRTTTYKISREKIASSDEVRLAHQLLTEALEPETAQTTPGLVISPDARALLLPDGEKVDLSRRKAPRLILKGLAQLRDERPGEGVSVYDLMDMGWPGESLHPDSGTNRVYVAITTLRKMGLRDIILHRDEGYLLDPSIRLERRAL